MTDDAYKIQSVHLDLHYGKFCALKDVSISIRPRRITAIIGPSGCGKSTLLRCFNRMNDLIPGVRVDGDILMDGRSILAGGIALTDLRRRVGMVFQRPNPFPLSVRENVLYGLRVHGIGRGADHDGVVERSLRATALWDVLKDKLSMSALALSAEQQQRLCISRVVAVEPEILLMDEPCSALDPIATAHIEELMRRLSALHHRYRYAQHAAGRPHLPRDGLHAPGDLVEFGQTEEIFTRPRQKKTEDYVTGRYG